MHLRSAYFAALLVAISTCTSITASSRNRAHDIVRGGAWLYHEEEHPCGADGTMTSCVFTSGNSRHLAESKESCGDSLSVSVSSEVINQLDPVTVTVDLNGHTPTKDDWIGAYCIGDESTPLDDKQYIDFQLASAANGSGQVTFGPLVNMRCSWQFRYFTKQGENKFVKLATTPYVRFKHGKQEPLHVHASSTETTSEMRISWVSAAVDAPAVEYGLSASSLDRRVGGSGESYQASDMCEAPATTVSASWFTDPGVMYNAVMSGLEPDTTYYYRIHGGGDAPVSETFKLRTPPAPGVQKGVASFFVFGDLGDWNVHATNTFKEKRSSTTIELMRRDMDDPKANYVAVMHDGDLSYAVGRTYLWDQFGALIQPVATEIPYMIGIGNHEYCYLTGGDKDPSGAGATSGFHPPEGNYLTDSYGECGVPTNKRFIMPANGNKVFWWSKEIGLAHHTMISSEHDYRPGSPMYQWLEKDLQSVDRTTTPWLFLHLHRPMYTSEAYDSDHKVALYIRKNIETLLGKYRVDAVFSGHYHAYELTCPVYMDECRSQPLGGGLKKALAPVHIMVGSAGADVDVIGYYDVPWREQAQLEYGYGRVHVHNATHAQWEFVRNRDEIVAGSTWIISDHDWTV